MRLDDDKDAKDATLISLKLFKSDDMYFLSARYHITGAYKDYDLIIPKISLPFPDRHPTMDLSYFGVYSLKVYTGNELELCKDDDQRYFYIENVVEHPAEEVTMEDVEKKFGHRVKIVNEK